MIEGMRALPLTLTLALASAVACEVEGPDLPPPGAPALDFTVINGEGAPDAVDFGAVDVGDGGFVDVLLHNHGDSPLRDVIVELPQAITDLSMSPTAPPRFLAVDESVALRLHFRPTEDRSIDELLLVFSDDPEGGEIQLPLRAEGLGPATSLRRITEPEDVVLGCASEFDLGVSNTGRGGLVDIRGVSLLGKDRGAFTSLRPDPETWLLGPGEERSFTVRFAPERVGPHSVTVRVDGPDDEAVSVELEATSILGGEKTDHFVQSEASAADLLFVIDSSPGMDHGPLLGAVDDLLGRLDEHGLDWHIGAITADVTELGLLRGPPAWVHAAHPEAMTAVQEAFDVGTSGNELEQGLHQAFLALSSPMSTGANAGFVRTEALLHLVFVSDDEDLSEPASGWTAAEYGDFFVARKLVSEDVVVSDITGGRQGCSGVLSATDGERYVDATESAGGRSWTYCDGDWGASLSGIADDSRRRERRFPLSSPAVDGTLRVVVGGVDRADGWDYDADAAELVFEPGESPAVGAAVAVTYVALGCNL
jgi:hypothetical protein